MSGFDASWLDLREPADHAARSKTVLDAVAEAFEGRDHVTVADLGSGSGSTLRALGPRLGRSQAWTLLDNDFALLAHARTRLAAWADDAREDGDALVLTKGGARIAVRTEVVDLHRDPLPASAAASDLVTASALFDLVAESWLNSFVTHLAASKRPLYAALSYDGAMRFEPAHPLDAAVVAAFNRHQTTDKGFGAALGPSATMTLGWLAKRAGYDYRMGESPWRLGPDQRPLMAELLAGIAGAAAELPDGPEGVTEWLVFHADADMIEIEHADVFLTPG